MDCQVHTKEGKVMPTYDEGMERLAGSSMEELVDAYDEAMKMANWWYEEGAMLPAHDLAQKAREIATIMLDQKRMGKADALVIDISRHRQVRGGLRSQKEMRKMAKVARQIQAHSVAEGERYALRSEGEIASAAQERFDRMTRTVESYDPSAQDASERVRKICNMLGIKYTDRPEFTEEQLRKIAKRFGNA
jgi:hypothetical protein